MFDVLIFIVQSLLVLILDTCSFRNLFNIRLNGESLLLKLLDLCELCMPAAVKEEIIDDVKKGEFASSEKEEEEVRTILKNARILSFYEIEKECYEVLKRTEINFLKLKTTADKQCLTLALQLSRHNKYKLRNIYLVTDDTELYNIAEDIFNNQFIGKTYSSYHLLVFFSVRRIFRIAKSSLLDILVSFSNIYKRTPKFKEIQKLMDNVRKIICPHGCKYRSKCIIFNL